MGLHSGWLLLATSGPAPELQEETNDAFLPECAQTGGSGSLAGKWTSGPTHYVTLGPSESSVAENPVTSSAILPPGTEDDANT